LSFGKGNRLLIKKKHQITNLNNTPKAHKELVGSNNKKILSFGKGNRLLIKKKHQITNLNNTPKAHKELVGSNNKEILSFGKGNRLPIASETEAEQQSIGVLFSQPKGKRIC